MHPRSEYVTRVCSDLCNQCEPNRYWEDLIFGKGSVSGNGFATVPEEQLVQWGLLNVPPGFAPAVVSYMISSGTVKSLGKCVTDDGPLRSLQLPTVGISAAAQSW